jgi:mRNA-degrading endonuclease RelE of RelBE toxin-antitoxin system
VQSGPLLQFIHTPLFDESAEEALSDDELRAVQAALQENPEAGRLISGTGGARKLRVATGGRGKSGGARVIYYYKSRKQTVYLLFAYAKSLADSLSNAGKKVIRDNIRVVDREG